MALICGTKLGPYEIVSPLGAGGMGEVYRARDTRLERDVAVKVLTANLSSDPNLRQRLEREAKAVSKLSHPHICTLHDIGHQDGVVFLVMELVEGDTLEQRLNKGPLPPEQTIRHGAEIADALSKAHKLGFTHRDLKPSNIMLTKTGAKLMDFGLAKQSGTAPLAAALTEMTAELSKLTGDGMVVGTFQYMAPEQLEGKEADARTDIFALGEVLYEMATGKPAFSGKSRASLIASILTTEPPSITLLQPLTPPALERIVKQCLAKDPDERWQSAHDLACELRWIVDAASQPGAAGSSSIRTRRSLLRWLAPAIAAAGLAAGLFLRAPEKKPGLRVAINIPTGSHLALNKQAVLSPNGQLVAMVLADDEGRTRLWVRQLDLDRARPLPGTDGAMAPFWSPDNQFLGFFTFENKLKKIALSDGTVQTLCDTGAGTDLSTYGGTWNRDGLIVFSSGNRGLYRVPTSGGAPSRIPVEGDYRWPSFLPDGRHLLVLSNGAGGGIFAVALEGGSVRTALAQESSPVRYADPGYILFARQGNLFAQPFNFRSLQTTGSAVTVAESAEPGPLSFSAAAGLLLHVEASKTQLTWVDREGNRLSAVGEPGYVSSPYISPDGKYAIASITDQQVQRQKLWLFDFQRDTANPFTFGAGNDAYAVWSPDGQQVAFSSTRENGQEDVFVKPVSGGGGEQPLLTQKGDKEPDKWSRDGRFLLFDYRAGREEGFDVWVLPMFGDRKPYPFIQRKGTDAYATFSPDGKWVAYQSDESGQTEIYVVPFPGPGGKWQVSKGGGGQPYWPRGKELFYVSNDFQLMAVEFEVRGKDFLVGKSRRLFERQSVGGSLSMNPDAGASIDVNGDGTRWLVAVPVDERNASPLILTMNWMSELKK
jgi:eukaryotic-like serine/threonine-protein kinase